MDDVTQHQLLGRRVSAAKRGQLSEELREVGGAWSQIGMVTLDTLAVILLSAARERQENGRSSEPLNAPSTCCTTTE